MACSLKLSKNQRGKKYTKINELKNNLIRFFYIKKNINMEWRNNTTQAQVI